MINCTDFQRQFGCRLQLQSSLFYVRICTDYLESTGIERSAPATYGAVVLLSLNQARPALDAFLCSSDQQSVFNHFLNPLIFPTSVIIATHCGCVIPLWLTLLISMQRMQPVFWHPCCLNVLRDHFVCKTECLDFQRLVLPSS